MEEEVGRKESILRDLRTRAENQADYIRVTAPKLQADREACEVEAQRRKLDARLAELQEWNAQVVLSQTEQQAKIEDKSRGLEEARRLALVRDNHLQQVQKEVGGMRHSLAEGRHQIQVLSSTLASIDMELRQEQEVERQQEARQQEALADPHLHPTLAHRVQLLHQQLCDLKKESDGFGAAAAAATRHRHALKTQVVEVERELERQATEPSAAEQEAEALTAALSTLRNEANALHHQLHLQVGVGEGERRRDQEVMAAQEHLAKAQLSQRRMEEEGERLEGELAKKQRYLREVRCKVEELAASSAGTASTQSDSAHTSPSSAASSAASRLTNASVRVDSLLQSLQEVKRWQAQMPPHPHMSGEASVQGGGGQWETRLANTRHLLLDKLIRHSQKQSLGRSLAAWLRSIEVGKEESEMEESEVMRLMEDSEALKMDRIMMQNDNYMSMDSSIDELLNDALAKRRARCIVASSNGAGSLWGSTIDDDVLQAAAMGVGGRPMSGGSSYAGSSIAGSLEWMV